MTAITEQWEYEIVPDPEEKELNIMGADGWQIVGVVPDAEDRHYVYMMRPKKTVLVPSVAQPTPYPWAKIREREIARQGGDTA